MPEGKGQEKKDEGKIVLETKIHCNACRLKVYEAVDDYPGVEDVTLSLKENKITLKAPKVDANKLFESVKKKSKGQIIKLVYPDPSEVKKKQEKEEKKPVEVTVVLKMTIDCASCTRKVKKAALDIAEIQSVKVEGDTLTVKGLDLDPNKVCAQISKKTKKHAEVVPPKNKEAEKKSNEKKDDSGKKDGKQNPQIVTQYVYAPQYFSEENPNACNII